MTNIYTMAMTNQQQQQQQQQLRRTEMAKKKSNELIVDNEEPLNESANAETSSSSTEAEQQSQLKKRRRRKRHSLPSIKRSRRVDGQQITKQANFSQETSVGVEANIDNDKKSKYEESNEVASYGNGNGGHRRRQREKQRQHEQQHQQQQKLEEKKPFLNSNEQNDKNGEKLNSKANNQKLSSSLPSVSSSFVSSSSLPSISLSSSSFDFIPSPSQLLLSKNIQDNSEEFIDSSSSETKSSSNSGKSNRAADASSISLNSAASNSNAHNKQQQSFEDTTLAIQIEQQDQEPFSESASQLSSATSSSYPSSTFVFRISVFNEDKSQSSQLVNFNVECKRMNANVNGIMSFAFLVVFVFTCYYFLSL
jgi:hypothetical protein